MILRVIKRKRKSRRKHECLSLGAAQGHYNYHGEQSSNSRVDDYADKIDYRRYNSVMEFSNGFSYSPKQKSRSVVIGSKELVT
ncbi:hypothetical protein MTR_5g098450 [Medicago truncatula]|uniref:Uncharacterized protein n=1 Tax=Medicago truncatula TaxID=3880 RepID=G7K0M4_MEDTR|nr:hypothetical protein MTR_5g098450 [Medicago truncatula]